MLFIAGTATAEDRPSGDVPIADAPRAESPVSMSPSSAPNAALANETSDAAISQQPRPLTRAATQQRIDDMSPVGWLASFGPVVVGDGSL